MKRFVCTLAVYALVFAAALLSAPCVRADQAVPEFRPPAVPLVVSDPYLSIWSEADHLTDDVTRHWTHRPHSLLSLIRIDGKSYRLMGSIPAEIPPMPQVGLEIWPTRSIYSFDNGQVHLTLTFMTPVLPDDLEVLARPVTYLTWDAHSSDGAAHAISLFDSASSQLAVNLSSEQVNWHRQTAHGLTMLQIGTTEQPILAQGGDDIRINWGYAYLTAPADQAVSSAIGSETALTRAFVDRGSLPVEEDTRQPRAVNDEQPVMAFAFDLGKVGAKSVSRHLMIAYDEIFAIKYFGRNLRPYWQRNGATPATLFMTAERDYTMLQARCERFDRQMKEDLEKEGGPRYAQIASLSYRQCLAGTGIAADNNKQPLLFTKENTSNGDIATVDVIFPMAPMLIFVSPTLAKASLVPILSYAASSHWKFPNAPHDLGTYPLARGTDDGGEGMPVEESGNVILLCDAIAQEEGNAGFVSEWWPQLTQWAQYLERYGLDPEDQLCTDDFMGHLAHNANLSVKAILALAAYGDLCKMRGDSANAERYHNLALTDSAHWVQVAHEGNHSRLAFDRPNTWSQKYNLIWDRILGLNVFPPTVAQEEVAYYKRMMQPYGVPLDSRTKLTKTDWSLWVASLADTRQDFETLVSPIYDYLNHTTARMPLVDSYITDNAQSDGMHARPVVGGIFIKMLTDRVVWNKWARRDHARVGGWAMLPTSPTVTEIVPTSRQTPVSWRYTTDSPGEGWTQPGFDVSSWKQGMGGFGTVGTPAVLVGTTWNTSDIWLRREITIPAQFGVNSQFLVFHDEDVEIYVNGVLAAKEGGFLSSYEPMSIRPAAQVLMKPGAKITLSVHCHQTEGGQGIDVGLVNVVERQSGH